MCLILLYGLDPDYALTPGFCIVSESSKMTLCTQPLAEATRPQRRPGRPPGGKKMISREMPGKLRSAYRRSIDPCDNSNDSGLG